MTTQRQLLPGGSGEALQAIDTRMMPFIAGALKQYQDERYWVADGFVEAYNVVTKLRCDWGKDMNELLRVLAATYRMLDNRLSGIEYNSDTPEPVPSVDIPDNPSTPLVAQSVNPGIADIKAKLQELIDANSAEDNAAILEKLQILIAAL